MSKREGCMYMYLTWNSMSIHVSAILTWNSMSNIGMDSMSKREAYELTWNSMSNGCAQGLTQLICSICT